MHVLAITSDAKIAGALGAALSRAGFTFTTAAHIHEALAFANREPPDAVICDIDLPDHHGVELIRRIRREQGEIPFIVLHRSDAQGGFAAVLDDLARSCVGRDAATLPGEGKPLPVPLQPQASPGEGKPLPVPLQPQALPAPAPLPRQVRIAIVDVDGWAEVPIRQAAVRAFGVTGAVVQRYEGALPALREFAQEPPHILIFELALPDLDGVTFMRLVRKTPRLAGIGTIAATKHPHWHTLTVVLDAGADNYIFKPVSPEVLAPMMRAMMTRPPRS